MPHYVVAVTHRKEYDVEAASPQDAIDSYWLNEQQEADRQDVQVGILRRIPQLYLPALAMKEYKVEYRHNGRLIFEQTTKRSNPYDVRDHSTKVRQMLTEMKKPVNEIRVRELSPEPMLGRVR